MAVEKGGGVIRPSSVKYGNPANMTDLLPSVLN